MTKAELAAENAQPSAAAARKAKAKVNVTELHPQ
jgi:hypothetical protein